MNVKTMKVASLFTVGCLMSAAQSNAAVVFSYTTGQSSYTALPGTTVSVPIYLNESLSNGSTDLITPGGGLISAGAAVNYSSVALGVGTAATFGSGSFTPASPFFAANSFAVTYYAPAGHDAVEASLIAPPGNYAFPTNNQVQIGTLSIVAGTGTTSFSLTSLNDDTIAGGDGGGGDQNTVTLSGLDVDAKNQTGYTGADSASPTVFTVGPLAAIIPEPASISLLGLGALGLARRRQS